MVRVLFLPFNGPEVPDTKSPLKWKREAIWDNAGRNELIAGVAEKLARKPRKVLHGYGISTKVVQLPDRVWQRVVVLVENVEHATRLQKLLPDWEVLHAIPTDDEPWDGEEDPNELPPVGVIATLVYVAKNGIGCDILVRATAGTGKLSWDAIRGGYKKAGTTPALVVDIGDEGGKRERRDTEIRRREYREQGLEVVKATQSKEGAT
ncbi:MAG: hypothetical protein ACKODX_00375 [Gemmata sp.]